MKNIVPVPVTPTPWERRRPNSFNNDLLPVSFLANWRSLSILTFFPESSVKWGLEVMSEAVLHKWEI